MHKIKLLKEKLKTLEKYSHIISLISYDFETICPKKALEEESDTLNYFQNEYFKLFKSEEFTNLIIDLNKEKDLLKDPLDKILIEKLYKLYEKEKNVTVEFDLERSKAYSKAHISWLKAKKEKNFSLFKDDFAKVIEISKKNILLRDKHHDNLYDDMLDDCEEGLLTDTLDPFFEELKNGIIELKNKIMSSKYKIDDSFLNVKVPIEKQRKFSNYLLKLNGFDFERGCIGETEHPFTSPIAKNDARVTTHYYEDNVLSNIYSIIHEGGHALCMQGEKEADFKQYINDSITNGMHESVSRFYENVIGRSEEYVHLIYPKFIELFKDEFKGFDLNERKLYEAINIVKPSLIRTEADEVTYSLHIIIRYEMEKLIVNGKIKLDDIPKMWNKMYKDYLGIEVDNDSVGVLQDVHWTSGFGYFPSYAIGNAYNQMYVQVMNKEFSLKEAIKKADFKKINNWMKKHIYFNANVLKPTDWIKEITGENLTPKYFLEYLNTKYKDIYKF